MSPHVPDRVHSTRGRIAVRILNVIGWLAPRYGGMREVVTQSQRWLTARGHQVDILTTNVDGDGVLDVATGRRVDWEGVSATFQPLSLPRRFLTSWPLLANLRRSAGTYDVIHVHGLYRFHTIAAASAARRRRVPYVLQAHGSLNPPTRARRRRLKDGYHLLVEDRNIRDAALLLCTSSQEEQAIRDLGYRVPTAIVPLGVDADALRLPSNPRQIPGSAGIRDDAQVVTFIGRISRGKGVDLLVRAFARTATAFPRAHLVIAGPDDEGIGRRLGPSIAAAGLSERISFIGTVGGSAKRALLQRSDVVVLPSNGESFGLAVAEAMAVGRPVIVSPAVPLQDVVVSAGAGLVVDRDPAEMAGAVSVILSNPEASAAMGQAGRQLVDARFTWQQVAVELEDVYRSIVDRPSGSVDAAES
jgi:glycosyltransferase involved in cell wall biosynthesis